MVEGDPAQNCHHILVAEIRTDLDGQALPGEVVDHGQRAQPAAITRPTNRGGRRENRFIPSWLGIRLGPAVEKSHCGGNCGAGMQAADKIQPSCSL